jgi:hypothetical protein
MYMVQLSSVAGPGESSSLLNVETERVNTRAQSLAVYRLRSVAVHDMPALTFRNGLLCGLNKKFVTSLNCHGKTEYTWLHAAVCV